MREGLGLGGRQGVQGLQGAKRTAGLPDLPGAMLGRAWRLCRGRAGRLCGQHITCRESKWLLSKPMPEATLGRAWRPVRGKQAGCMRWQGKPVAAHGPQGMQVSSV